MEYIIIGIIITVIVVAILLAVLLTKNKEPEVTTRTSESQLLPITSTKHRWPRWPKGRLTSVGKIQTFR
jgi:hypothetical protein